MNREKLLVTLGWVFLLVFCSGLLAEAEETLNIEKVIEYALTNNAEVKKAEYQVEIARSALKLTQNNTFSPAVAVSQNVSLGGDFAPGLTINIKDSLSFRASDEEEKARLNLAQAERNLASVKETVKKACITTYLALLENQQSLTLAQKTYQLMQKKYEKTKVQAEEGNASLISLLEAEKNLREAEYTVENLTQNSILLKKQLNGIMGRSLDTPFAVEPLPEISFPPVHLEELKAKALTTHREVEEVKSERASLEIDLKSLRKEKQPVVKLLAEYQKEDWSLSAAFNASQGALEWEIAKNLSSTYNNSSFLTGTSEEDWGIGMVISWNLSSGGTLEEQEKQLKLQIAQNDETLRALQADLENTIESKYLEFRQAQNEGKLRATTLRIAEEEYRVKKTQWEQGAIDSIALLESELAFLQAQNDYQKNIFTSLTSWLDLEETMGEPISFQNLVKSDPKGVNQ